MKMGKCLGLIKLDVGKNIEYLKGVFRRAVVYKLESESESLIIEQFKYICVFCEQPAYRTFKGRGICESCLEDIKRKYGGQNE